MKFRTRSGRFTSLKQKVSRGLKILALVAIATTIATSYFSTTTVQAGASETVVVEAPSPILDRIADCESGNGKPGTATQTRNGQVLISMNTNGTYDQGKFQINSIWNKKAAELGFNLATEEGNTSFAKWLYANKGTGDWASSAKCWSR